MPLVGAQHALCYIRRMKWENQYALNMVARYGKHEPIEGEEWRSLGDGLEVSSEGRARLTVTVPIIGRIQKRGLKKEYRQIKVRGKQHYLHVLVAQAFLGPKPFGLDVNHKDGDKDNNKPSNLEYITRKENIRHAQRLGLRAVSRKVPNAARG